MYNKLLDSLHLTPHLSFLRQELRSPFFNLCFLQEQVSSTICFPLCTAWSAFYKFSITVFLNISDHFKISPNIILISPMVTGLNYRCMNCFRNHWSSPRYHTYFYTSSTVLRECTSYSLSPLRLIETSSVQMCVVRCTPLECSRSQADAVY